jgi:DNA-directed RNA polymerase specialized sigma subunit
MFGVVRHRAAQLAAQQRRRLQFLVDDGGSHRPQVIVNHDLRLDVAGVVASLPEHLRVIAELLSERTPREVAHVTGKSRSRVYQMIGEIRAAFEEAGVGPGVFRHHGGGR